MHPFPAEHDQQQAHALDILKDAEAFVLIHFTKKEEECDHPFCEVMHHHRTTTLVASCSHGDLHRAIDAIGQEILITTSIDTLMSLTRAQREQVAAILRSEGETFFRLEDDEA